MESSCQALKHLIPHFCTVGVFLNLKIIIRIESSLGNVPSDRKKQNLSWPGDGMPWASIQGMWGSQNDVSLFTFCHLLIVGYLRQNCNGECYINLQLPP